MDPFEYETERFLSRTIQLWVSKLEAELWKFAEAIDAWFYGPYRSDPSKWREQLAQVLDEQASLGRELIPKSRGELFAFLENWERTQRATTSTSAVPTQLTAAFTSVSEKPQPRVVADKKPPPRRSGHRPGPNHRVLNKDEAFYLAKLAEANRHIDEIEPLLSALAGRIEGAKPEEDLDVTAQLEAIDALIWRHNDALESARDTWLRGNISSDLYAKLDQTRLPTSLGLPLFTDRDQAARAKAQAIAMGQKFKAQIAWLDNVIFAMQVMETAGDVASFLLVAGPLITVLKSGTKVILKTAAKAAAAEATARVTGAIAKKGLEAAGVSEETIENLANATEIISRLLLYRKISSGSNVPKPSTAKTNSATKSVTTKSPTKKVPSPPPKRIVSVPPTAVRTNAQLVDDVGARAQRWAQRKQLTGTPRQIGTRQHKYARDVLDRYQAMFGDRNLVTERSFILGTEVPYGTKGSTRLDVLDAVTGEVWDYKFGTTPMTQSQIWRIFQNGPGVISVTPVYKP